MHVEKVVTGNEVSMPLIALGKGGGVTIVKSLVDGLLIRLSPEESQCGIVFIPEDKLKEAGYFTLKLSDDDIELGEGSLEVVQENEINEEG